LDTAELDDNTLRSPVGEHDGISLTCKARKPGLSRLYISDLNGTDWVIEKEAGKNSIFDAFSKEFHWQLERNDDPFILVFRSAVPTKTGYVPRCSPVESLTCDPAQKFQHVIWERVFRIIFQPADRLPGWQDDLMIQQATLASAVTESYSSRFEKGMQLLLFGGGAVLDPKMYILSHIIGPMDRAATWSSHAPSRHDRGLCSTPESGFRSFHTQASEQVEERAQSPPSPQHIHFARYLKTNPPVLRSPFQDHCQFKRNLQRQLKNMLNLLPSPRNICFPRHYKT
jgi:hypothetical protein